MGASWSSSSTTGSSLRRPDDPVDHGIPCLKGVAVPAGRGTRTTSCFGAGRDDAHDSIQDHRTPSTHRASRLPPRTFERSPGAASAPLTGTYAAASPRPLSCTRSSAKTLETFLEHGRSSGDGPHYSNGSRVSAFQSPSRPSGRFWGRCWSWPAWSASSRSEPRPARSSGARASLIPAGRSSPPTASHVDSENRHAPQQVSAADI
jgi:hypothetical protein